MHNFKTFIPLQLFPYSFTKEKTEYTIGVCLFRYKRLSAQRTLLYLVFFQFSISQISVTQIDIIDLLICMKHLQNISASASNTM